MNDEPISPNPTDEPVGSAVSPASEAAVESPAEAAPATESPDSAASTASSGPALGIGSIVRHPSFGLGRVLSYEGTSYVILFRGESKKISFDYMGMKVEEREGHPEMDQIKEAVREVLSDYGWIDTSLELSSRWQGGEVIFEPGKAGTQAKVIPIDQFFKKIIGVREKLRVLEQKINSHKSLGEEEKLELEGYITRCYGSLTTFNALFADKESYFKGTGKGS